jgi:Ca-activated chloride channel family protein
MHFESPLAFLLLILIPLLIYMRLFRNRGGAIQFSSVGNAVKASRSIKVRLIRLPDIIRIIALILIIIALARPQTGRERISEISKGIAIMMVVDRSGSMNAELEYRGQNLNRLEAVKQVFKEFVLGGTSGLKGRPNDLIGMIVFARYPDTICPLTLAHGALPAFLKNVNIVQTREEDGTAIGDAIALAAARLKRQRIPLRTRRRGQADMRLKAR